MLALALVAGCRPAPTTPPSSPDASTPSPAAPPLTALDHETRIFDAEGREHSVDSLLGALAEHREGSPGEALDRDALFRVEHALLEGLAERHEQRLVLSMEMFTRDAQPILDRYMAGEIDEASMLERANPWNNYRTGYRPLVETARAHQLPLVAANPPRSTLMKAVKGKEAYDQIRTEHPDWLPAKMFPASDAYWDRVDRTIRGHGPPKGRDRTYSVQNLWDNTMADSIVQATEAHPEHALMHVVGGFHIDRHDGTVAQIRHRAPDLDLVTVSVVPTSDLARATPAPERADFIVYAANYAQGPSGGSLSVGMPASLDYRLSLPDGPAPAEGWPLLVWLSDDEQRPDDAVLRWRMALGSDAAVIVVEPPHRTRARQGWLIRRWAWPSSWGSDLSAAAIGVGRIIEYARRRLPVREAPVLVAGEGAGGTLALWAAHYGSDWDGVRVTAIDPQLPHALRTASIPDEPSAIETLEVFGQPDEGTLAGLDGVGLTPKVAPAPPPGTPRDALILSALGLSPAPPSSTERPSPDPAAPDAVAGRPVDVRISDPSALSTSWAALYTSMLAARGHDAHLILEDAPGTPRAETLAFDGPAAGHTELLLGVFAEGKGLPRTPDPFGGAVVLLIPRGARSKTVARWSPILEGLEAKQGFIKTPYRAVLEGDAKGLTAVFDELRDKGRTEVLVVPVELCATGRRMQGYMDAIEPAAEGLSLHWLPGLGHHVVKLMSAATAAH